MKRTRGGKNTNRRAPAPAAGKNPDGLLPGVRRHRLQLAALTEELASQRARLVEHQGWLAIAQGQVVASQRRIDELHEVMPVPYLMLSDLGVIVKVNQHALDLLGTERTWVVGRPLVAYVEPRDLKAILNEVYRCPTGQTTTVEIHLRTARGSRPVQLAARCEAGGHGMRGILHVTMVDLTALRQLETERREAEESRRRSEEGERVARAANEAKDEFQAMLSHELRTPLTPILAAADSLIAHDSLPPQTIAKLDVIRRNVRAEARLIDDLLDVARITRKSFDVIRRPIDLHAVMQQVVEAWRETFARENRDVDLRLEAGCHWVEGDAERLGQVFRNLVGNAVKFSEACTRISVRTEEHEGRIRVTVADEGAGMTESQLATLFKPFVRAVEASPRRGLGLGLVISRAIVEAHEGTLHVWSGGKGCGTTVRVEMDAIAAPAQEVTPADAQPAAGPTTARVLLVEDDRDSAEMLALMLSSEGFDVRVARSVHRARALADHCEVIVSDIALPDGSGLDLMRGLRAERPIRGIALSGYGSLADIKKSLDAGFEEHLTKPVDLEELVTAVRRLAAQTESANRSR